MKSTIAALAGIACGAVISTGAFAYGVGGGDPGHGRVDIPAWVVRPCPTEDSVNCRWVPDKAYLRQHPHVGGWDHVSIRRQMPNYSGQVCVFYAVHKYAKRHDYCT